MPTYTKPAPNPRTMNINELRELAAKQGLEARRQAVEQNPNDSEARQEYETYCQQLGVRPMDRENQRLYETDMDTLRKEWETKGQVIADKELDEYRTRNAKTWLVSQPEYVATPQNAEAIENVLNSSGMKGSVADIQLAYEIAIDKGLIEAPIRPVRLLTEEEQREIPLPELKAYFDGLNR